MKLQDYKKFTTVITLKDLDGFSQELIDSVTEILNR